MNSLARLLQVALKHLSQFDVVDDRYHSAVVKLRQLHPRRGQVLWNDQFPFPTNLQDKARGVGVGVGVGAGLSVGVGTRVEGETHAHLVQFMPAYMC